jgi:prevent-host-death family protein
MSRIPKEGSEEARKRLPTLLERANRGKPTLITKRGVPYAAIMPVNALVRQQAGISIQDLRGSGKGLWGKDVPAWIERIRNEWE